MCLHTIQLKYHQPPYPVHPTSLNPGGKVFLNGTLTASCEAGWDGVEVQGDGEANQYDNEGLAQGYLECNKPALIEHALVAVKLYGPDWEDAGGQIYAEGANFINNRRGLDFAPYNNYFPEVTDQKSYYSG